MSKSIDSFHIEIGEEEFEVEVVVYEYTGEPRSYSSGGSPPEFEVEVNEITDWDGKSVLDRMYADEDFCDKVYDRVYNKAREG